MTSVEVLAPLRIETRFYPPTEERNSWLLRLRVYPDEFSMARVQPPTTTAELKSFDEILTAYQGSEADGETQLQVLASKVGTERAIWLRRTVTVVTAGGVPHADRKGLQDRDPGKFPLTQKPFGLPPEIHVWLVKLNDTMPYMSAVMQPNRAAIAGDLDLGAFETQSGVNPVVCRKPGGRRSGERETSVWPRRSNFRRGNPCRTLRLSWCADWETQGPKPSSKRMPRPVGWPF